MHAEDRSNWIVERLCVLSTLSFHSPIHHLLLVVGGVRLLLCSVSLVEYHKFNIKKNTWINKNRFISVRDDGVELNENKKTYQWSRNSKRRTSFHRAFISHPASQHYNVRGHKFSLRKPAKDGTQTHILHTGVMSSSLDQPPSMTTHSASASSFSLSSVPQHLRLSWMVMVFHQIIRSTTRHAQQPRLQPRTVGETETASKTITAARKTSTHFTPCTMRMCWMVLGLQRLIATPDLIRSVLRLQGSNMRQVGSDNCTTSGTAGEGRVDGWRDKRRRGFVRSWSSHAAWEQGEDGSRLAEHQGEMQ